MSKEDFQLLAILLISSGIAGLISGFVVAANR